MDSAPGRLVNSLYTFPPSSCGYAIFIDFPRSYATLVWRIKAKAQIGKMSRGIQGAVKNSPERFRLLQFYWFIFDNGI